MARRREVNVFSLSFLDLISGALGAVIILYVAVPKGNPLEGQLEKVVQDVKAKDAKMQELQKEIEELRQLRDSAQQAIQENEQLKAQVEAPKPEENSDDGQGLEVGFKFKGKNVVFILDTSRSMEYIDTADGRVLKESARKAGGHDRMGQVKAGLKMLLMSMPKSFNVDIVQFPYGERAPYRPYFGQLKPLDRLNKLDLIDFIYGLIPQGATPTRQTLTYVFEHYKDVSDIVLLTDGEPSMHNSNIKDDVFDLLRMVRQSNKVAKIQINAIGVGQEVLHDKTAKPYQFLRLLAEENQGFFVGF